MSRSGERHPKASAPKRGDDAPAFRNSLAAPLFRRIVEFVKGLPFPSRERIQTPTLSYGRPRTRCENCGAAAVRFLTAPARGLVRLRCGACLHEWDTADRRATPRPD